MKQVEGWAAEVMEALCTCLEEQQGLQTSQVNLFIKEMGLYDYLLAK